MNLEIMYKMAQGMWKPGMPKKAAEYLYDKVKIIVRDEKLDREEFRRALENWSDDELMVYVPNVYQEDIYKIDYKRLKEKGIQLISFDIDDTIDDSFINKLEANAPMLTVTMPDKARELVRGLKDMGFRVVLLTNAQQELAEGACKDLGADDYIARAKKPETGGFEIIASRYGLDKSQMAHVGNSMRDDIAGGNRYGVTTCLVRRAGISLKLVKFAMKMLGMPTKGHLIREKLLARDIWRKHHAYNPGDQYYQLGEKPECKMSDKTDVDIAVQAAKNLIQKFNADKEQVFDVDELLRNAYEEKNSDAIKTLEAHLGNGILLTGTWDAAQDMRELEESELLDGEMSAFVFTVGSYMIRQAACLYQDSDGIYYTDRKAVGKDAISAYKEYDTEYRKVCEISAKYIGGNKNSSEGWQHVCLADVFLSWSEDIDFICTVKSTEASPDSHEALFVLKEYTGSAFSVDHWYRLTPDGTVKEYVIHPLDPDSGTEPWELSDVSEKEMGT